MAHTIFSEKLYTGDSILDNQLISCDKGVITSIQTANGSDADRRVKYLSAGFNDIHINGGSRQHLTKTPETQSVEDIASSSEALGTAYTLPTLVTSPLDNILKGIEAVKNFREKNPGAGVIGMHLEGPFINPVKRGAHLPEYIQQPSTGVLQEIIKYGRGIIKMITIAPELFSEDQIGMLLESGITVSAGHSNATYEEAQAAFTKGICLVTHLYNAMSGLGHRSPGLTGATFDNINVYAPIILDGEHCHFAAARIAHAIKKDKLFLISDALFTGDKMKYFQWGNFDSFLRDGRYVNSEGNLSGAAISMGDALRNAVNKAGIGLQEAVEMATVRPAAALHLQKELGMVKPGYPAVFTSFDRSLTHFETIRFNPVVNVDFETQ